jgi:hypothetical protein
MKVTVTHLKAPWPQGVVVGSVVTLAADAMPGWATGKCTPAAEDAEAGFTWEPPAPAVEPLKAAPAVSPEVQASIDAAVSAAVEPLKARIDALQALVPVAVGELTVNPEQPAGTGGAAMSDIEAQAAQERAAIEAKAGKARAAKG